jgi:hypothetical protein
MNWVLLASSATKQGIEKCIKEFYKYNSICIVDVENGTVSNAKGIINNVRIIKKGKRFRFESI